MKRSFALIVIAALALPLAGASCSQSPTHSDLQEFAILFIGNSLTMYNELPEVLHDLLEKESGLKRVFVESIAKPGYGLEDHWNLQSTKDKLASRSWDLVVMQQGPSATEGRPSLIEYAEKFAEPIRAAGAEPALYMVWPAEVRRFDFAGVRSSYRAAADSVDGYFFPAGAAWEEAWDLDNSFGLYGADGFHPSELGTYLAAVVMFEQITGKRAQDLNRHLGTRYGPIRIEPNDGERLHDAARAANRKYARTK